MDFLQDLKEWVKDNPLDLSECDNYEPWGGSSPGEGNYFYGMKHTDEWKDEMSSSHTGRGNPFYGKKHSDRTKQLMRESAKRRAQTNFADNQRKSRCVNNNYKFLNPEGECVMINGSLNKFCSDNGLNTGAMSQVHQGKVNHHKGWRKG